MAKCLVTGGAGFIGSHLVEALVAEGHRVRVLDDLSTGSRSNLAAVTDSVELIVGDVGDSKAVRDAVRETDLVFHVAAVPSVPESIANPMETHRVCATGTLNVLTAALEANVRRVVYATTSSVYGESAASPLRESDPPAPLAPYPVAKFVGEQYCRMFGEAYGLQTVCLRYFHVFGPRQRAGGPYAGVIPLFIDAMLAGSSPVVYGDGMQSRDFTSVEDAVRATLLAAEAPEAAGNLYNIGSGRPVTMLDLVAAINDVLGTRIRPAFSPPRVVHLRQSLADIAHARSDLGYEPAVTLEEGIRRCVESRRTRQIPSGPSSAWSHAGTDSVLVGHGW